MVSKEAVHFCFRKVFLKFCRIHMWAVPQVKRNSFPMNFAKFLRILFYRTPRTTATGFFSFAKLFFATCLTNRNQVFSIFEYVFRKVKWMQGSLISWTLYSLCFAKQTTQLLQQGNSCCCRHFSETPEINLYWISVLYCPEILRLKVTEAAADVIHWFRGVL